MEGRLREEEDAIDGAGGIWEVPTGDKVGTRLLILSSEVFDSGKNPLASGPSLFEVYLWAGRTLLGELELSDGEGLVGGSEPAADVDVDDSMNTGNVVVQGLKERFTS